MKVKTLQKDVLLSDVPSGNTVFARNTVFTEKYGSVSNEDGFNQKLVLTKRLIGAIDTNKEDIIFTGEDTTSEIGIFRNDVYTRILLATGLDFDRESPIDGIYFYNSNNELNVIWWDGNLGNSHKPKILNLDCLPFEVDANKEPINPDDLILLDLHQPNPSADLDIEIRNNGNIECGAYYPVFAYKLPDGSYTNFSHPFHPIYINDDSSKIEFQNNDGCKGGDLVNKSILLKFTNLNNAYKNITVALIKKTDGEQSAISLGEVAINGTSGANIVFSDINSTSDVSLESLLIDSPIYMKAQSGVILESKLHLLNLSLQEKPEIQQYVNNIDVEWVLEDGGNLCDFENSNKDSEYTFFNKSFKSGETYALYLVCKVKNLGLVAYHIPAKGATGISRAIVLNSTTFGPGITLQSAQSTLGGPGSNVNIDEGLLVSPDAKIFHVFNTAQADGKMGVWENKDEKYPSKTCWDIYNASGVFVGTYQNQNVTHHTFPSWQRLLEFDINNNLYKINDVSKLTLLASAIGDSDIDGSFSSVALFEMPTTTALTGTWNVAGNEFTATEDMNFYLRVLYTLVNAPSDTSPAGHLNIVKVLGTDINEIIVTKTFDGSVAFQGEEHEEIELKAGETLRIGFDSTENCEGLLQVYLINKKLEDNDITSKKLGIKLKNVNIPASAQDEIEWWSLGFAERTNNNITRSGQVLMLPDTRIVSALYLEYDPLIENSGAIIDYNVLGYKHQATNSFRTHNFDHLFFKTNINVDFISGNLKIGTADTYDFHNYMSPFIDSGKLIKAVKESSLVPENLTAENNRAGELYHSIKLETVSDFGLSKYQFLQADLGHYKENVYLNFDKQNIVVCDSYFEVSDVESDNIYQGDVFINLQGLSVSAISDLNVGSQSFYLIGFGDKNDGISNKQQDNLLYISENIANVGFRYKDENNDNRYYPKYISKQISPVFLSTDEEKVVFETGVRTQGLLYNTDFNSINNIKEILIFTCVDGCITEITNFPVRIARSPAINNESLYNSWRRFRPNDYYDGLPKDRGEGWVLRVYNRSLIIQLNEGLYLATPKDIIKSDATFAYLGSGDLFDRLPDEIIPDGSGYIGCRSKWGTGVCKHGYFVWDSVQGKLFVFNGQVDEISNTGMREYFQLNSAMPSVGTNAFDNPFNRNAITAGFDEKYNRLLVTRIIRVENLVLASFCQTLSYSFDLKGWTNTGHDYWPSIYLYNRRGLFSIDNNASAITCKLYQHNVDGVPCIYYERIQYPSYFDVVFNNEKNDVLWESIQWLSEYLTTLGVTYENTISHIMVYTNHHTTGLIELKKLINLVKTSDNTRRKNYNWSFNKLRDIILNKNTKPVLDNGDINTGNINNNLPFFKKNTIISPFVVVRFYIANTVTDKIHISEVSAQFSEYE